MSDTSLFTAALQSTANFKHHITGALKQKDLYIFFINLGWLLRLTLCIVQCNSGAARVWYCGTAAPPVPTPSYRGHSI